MRILIILLFTFILLPFGNSFAGGVNSALFLGETDRDRGTFVAAFDLRKRESFLQLTNVDTLGATVHVQIYDVSSLCNENDFFDVYTPNDTHVYNLRNILTNDGNPSGVELPADSYGILFISVRQIPSQPNPANFLGNMRIEDNNGYEYRTNIQGTSIGIPTPQFVDPVGTFNFNTESGVILSDVFGIAVSSQSTEVAFGIEGTLDNVLNTFLAVDIDIVDNNEVLFSCRDVIFSCINESNPLEEELISLAEGSSASVARFEYGINNAIPNSKGGELLCPGNVISEGAVVITPEAIGDLTFGTYIYVGLNNGNGRGSMDSVFSRNPFSVPPG